MLVVSLPEAKSSSNPPLNTPPGIDGTKRISSRVSFTGAPFSIKLKFMISPGSTSSVLPKAVAGVGFATVNENDHVSPGALQLLIAAPAPQVPLAETLIESALAPAAASRTRKDKTRQRVVCTKRPFRWALSATSIGCPSSAHAHGLPFQPAESRTITTLGVQEFSLFGMSNASQPSRLFNFLQSRAH